MKDWVKVWWRGRFIPTINANFGHGNIQQAGYFQRPWQALAIDNIKKHLKKHWQFWVGTGIGIISILVALVK